MWLAVDPYFEKNYASEVWYEKRAGLEKRSRRKWFLFIKKMIIIK